MISLLLYEFRSRLGGLLTLWLIFLLWDMLLLWNLSNFEVLQLTLLYMTSIGYFIISTGYYVFHFHLDFLTRHFFFVSLTPVRKETILLSKLLPIWVSGLLFYFTHSAIIVFTFIRLTDRTNEARSLFDFCKSITAMNCFLFLLSTVCLLFFWIITAAVRYFSQNYKFLWSLIVAIVVIGSTALLYVLQLLFLRGLSSQDLFPWRISLQQPFYYAFMIVLSVGLFWVLTITFKKQLDQ